MSDRLDRVLSAIDSGLQSSGETGYTFDVMDRCARCQRIEAVEGGDICAGCRLHLLGDGPDPILNGPTSFTQQDMDQIFDAFAATVELIKPALQQWMDGVGAMISAYGDLLGLFADPEPRPRTHPCNKRVTRRR